MARRLLPIAAISVLALFLFGFAFSLRNRKADVVGRHYRMSQYSFHAAQSVPLMTSMRSIDFRPDGTATVDRYVQGEGTWRRVGDEVEVTFTRLDGKPAADLKGQWPTVVKRLVEAENKEMAKYGGHGSGRKLADALAAPYPYGSPWRFRLSHRLITSNGPAYVLQQTAGDETCQAEYREPDF